MAVLDDIKIMLGIDINDSSQDNLLNLLTRKAVTLIKNYLNLDTEAVTMINKFTGQLTTIQPIDVIATYPDAIIEYVTLNYRKKGNEGLKQFTQGSLNGTYVDDLPDSVKCLLPAPYVTMHKVRRDEYVSQ